jgi:hypothetical protein
MAAMAIAQPSSSEPVVRNTPRQPPFAWLVWIGVSVVGTAVGAIVAWQVRSLWQQPAASSMLQDVAYAATLASALIAGGAQWLFFRTFRIEADWWAPATAAANLLNAAIVVPVALRLVLPSTLTSAPSKSMALLAGAVALGAAGLVVGAAQALVLRRAMARMAPLWVPATALGGAVAGAITTSISSLLYGMPAIATISLAGATGALLIAVCQSPLIFRFVR